MSKLVRISRFAAGLGALSLAAGTGAHAQMIAPSAVPIPVIVPPPPPPRVMPDLTDRQVSQLQKMLAGASAHGVPDEPFARAVTTHDVTILVPAVMNYARAVHSGRLREDDFLSDWGLKPGFYDPWDSFVAAAKQDRLASWIASLPPPYTGYDGLRRGLAAYRAMDANGGWSRIAPGPDLTIGSTGPRVAALRKRLAIENAGAVGGSGDRFDAALADQVKRVQRRYGLNPSGIVSTATIDALNVPAGERVRQIAANMERWRWLPRELARDRVQVNIAAAVLTVFEADAPITSMRAATGRPGDETPMLQSTIHSIVLNPPWNVPSSIATKELWPKERANPGYLARTGYKIIETPDGGKRLQQKPGPRSALGRVKFDFDNRYAVYLHDTPSQGTFGKYARLVSHGCVRLEHPVDLAKLVLRDDPAWSGDAIDTAIASNDTKRVKLSKPVAVYLLYWTAFAGANGQVGFRGDPYGWDRILATKIEAYSGHSPLADLVRKGI